MKRTNISEIIAEIKSYQLMQEELKAQIEELKLEAIEYLNENEIEEFQCDAGRITYREVISRTFNTTAFKKDFMDVYNEYLRTSSAMRFTCK